MAIYIPGSKKNATIVAVGLQQFDTVYLTTEDKNKYWSSKMFVPYFIENLSDDWFIGDKHNLNLVRGNINKSFSDLSFGLNISGGLFDGDLTTKNFTDSSESDFNESFSVIPTSHELTIDLNNKDFGRLIPKFEKYIVSNIPHRITVVLHWEGINKYYINGQTYNKSDIDFEENETTSELYFKENETIVWSIENEPGYTIGVSNGMFTLICNETLRYDINPSVILENITIGFNWDGVKSYKLSYNDSSYITYTNNIPFTTVAYNTKVKWEAELKDGYQLVGENQSTGEFIARENTIINCVTELKDIDIYLSTDYVKSYKINNQIINIEDFDEGSIKVKYGTIVNWEAVPIDGYELKPDSGNFMAIDFENGHTISPTASLIKIPVNIIFSEGIKTIIVNEIQYTNNIVINVDYGKELEWSYVTVDGYDEVSDNDNTIESVTTEITINPLAQIKQISISLEFDDTVASITINNQQYTSDDELIVNYGTLINWSAIPKTGYTLVVNSGIFTATQDTTIKPTTEIVSVPLTIVVNEGINNISVTIDEDAISYTSTITIQVPYNKEITWEATSKEGYEPTLLQDSLTINQITGHIISPIVTLKTIELSVVKNEGVAKIIVNGIEVNDSVLLPYGSNISWEAEFEEGYEGTSSGTILNIVSDTELAPVASKIKIPIKIRFSEGIKTIVVNGDNYTSNTDISVDYNTTVTWSIETEEGYESIIDDEVSFTANLISGYEIYPLATKIKVNVIISFENLLENSKDEEESSFIKDVETIDGDYNPDDATPNWKPIRSFSIGDFKFEFENDGGTSSQNPAIYTETTSHPYYDVRLYNHSKMKISSNVPNVKIVKLFFDGHNRGTGYDFIASTGKLQWIGNSTSDSDLLWEGYSNEVTITTNTTYQFHEVRITYRVVDKDEQNPFKPIDAIENIIVNGIPYVYDGENAVIDGLYVDYGTLVSWILTIKQGYSSNIPGSSFIARESTIIPSENIQISKVPVGVKILFSEGIKSVTVNNKKYESKNYENKIVDIDGFKYGDYVEWSSELENGYVIVGQQQGYFRITSLEDYVISPVAQQEVHRTTSIEVTSNYAPFKITIDGAEYNIEINETKTIDISGNSKISWEIEYNGEYDYIEVTREENPNEYFNLSNSFVPVNNLNRIKIIPDIYPITTIDVTFDEGIKNIEFDFSELTILPTNDEKYSSANLIETSGTYKYILLKPTSELLIKPSINVNYTITSNDNYTATRLSDKITLDLHFGNKAILPSTQTINITSLPNKFDIDFDITSPSLSTRSIDIRYTQERSQKQEKIDFGEEVKTFSVDYNSQFYYDINVADGYELVNADDINPKTGFTVTENTTIPVTIIGKPVQFKLVFNEGIQEYTLDGETISKPEDSNEVTKTINYKPESILWTAVPEEGYSIIDDESTGTITIDIDKIDEGYEINIIPYYSIPVLLLVTCNTHYTVSYTSSKVLHENVTINYSKGQGFYETTQINIDKGSTLEWEADTNSITDKIRFANKSENYTPIASKNPSDNFINPVQQVKHTFIINTDKIDSLEIPLYIDNGIEKSYNWNLESDAEKEFSIWVDTFDIKTNSLANYEYKLYPKYGYDSNIGGNKSRIYNCDVIEGSEHTINSVPKQVLVRFDFGDITDNIVVSGYYDNGREYTTIVTASNSTRSMYFDFGSILTWTANPIESSGKQPVSGILNITSVGAYTITPDYGDLSVPVSILISSGINTITVSYTKDSESKNDVFGYGTQINVDYNQEVSWEASISDNTIFSINTPSGSFVPALGSAYTIDPKTQINYTLGYHINDDFIGIENYDKFKSLELEYYFDGEIKTQTLKPKTTPIGEVCVKMDTIDPNLRNNQIYSAKMYTDYGYEFLFVDGHYTQFGYPINTRVNSANYSNIMVNISRSLLNDLMNFMFDDGIFLRSSVKIVPKEVLVKVNLGEGVKSVTINNMNGQINITESSEIKLDFDSTNTIEVTYEDGYTEKEGTIKSITIDNLENEYEITIEGEPIPAYITYTSVSGNIIPEIEEAFGDDYIKTEESDGKYIAHIKSYITETPENFLSENSDIKTIKFEGFNYLEHINNGFLNYDSPYTNANLISLELSEMPKLTSVGDSFLLGNAKLNFLTLTGLSNVTKIGSNFLKDCKVLASLDLSPLSNIEEFGNSCLYVMPGLTDIDFSPLTKLKKVGSYFFGFNNLESIDLSPLTELENIGINFIHDSPITNVIFGTKNKLKTIGAGFLGKKRDNNTGLLGHPSLETIEFGDMNALEELPEYFLSNEDPEGHFTNLRSVKFGNMNALKKFNGSAGTQLCYGATALEEIEFGDMNSITEFGTFFLSARESVNQYRCKSLKSIKFGNMNSMEILSGEFIHKLASLEDIRFGELDSLEQIISDFCVGNPKLTSIDLRPFKNIKYLGGYGFGNCYFETIDLSPLSNLTKIGDYIFTNSPKLKSLDLTPFKNIVEFDSPQDSKTFILGNNPQLTELISPTPFITSILPKYNEFTEGDQNTCGNTPMSTITSLTLLGDEIHTDLDQVFIPSIINDDLKIYVPHDLLSEYKETFPELSNRFYCIEHQSQHGPTVYYTTVDNLPLPDKQISPDLISSTDTPVNGEFKVEFPGNTTAFGDLFRGYPNDNWPNDFPNISPLKTVRFENCENVLVLGPFFISVGSRKIEYHNNLVSVDFSGLENVNTITDTGTSYDFPFLSYCNSLSTIDLSLLYNIESIPNYFLCECKSLDYIDLSPLYQVTHIGNWFLSNCSNLTSIDLPPLSQIMSIKDGFLYGCSSLNSIDLSPLSQVTSIGYAFLQDCSGLTSIDLSPLSQVTSIGNNFLAGTYIKSVISPAGLITSALENLSSYITMLTLTSDIVDEGLIHFTTGLVPSDLKIYVPEKLLRDYEEQFANTQLVGRFFCIEDKMQHLNEKTYIKYTGPSQKISDDVFKIPAINHYWHPFENAYIIECDPNTEEFPDDMFSDYFDLTFIEFNRFRKLKKIGNNFISSWNKTQPYDSKLKSVFLDDLPELESIGDHFMHFGYQKPGEESADGVSIDYVFNELKLSNLPKLKTIGTYFLNNAYNYDGEFDFNIFQNLTFIPKAFIRRMGRLNKEKLLTYLSNVVEIDELFMCDDYVTERLDFTNLSKLKTISNTCCFNMSKLDNVYIGGPEEPTIESIGTNFLGNCRELRTVRIAYDSPGENIKIGNGLLVECDNIRSLHINQIGEFISPDIRHNIRELILETKTFQEELGNVFSGEYVNPNLEIFVTHSLYEKYKLKFVELFDIIHCISGDDADHDLNIPVYSDGYEGCYFIYQTDDGSYIKNSLLETNANIELHTFDKKNEWFVVIYDDIVTSIKDNFCKDCDKLVMADFGQLGNTYIPTIQEIGNNFLNGCKQIDMYMIFDMFNLNKIGSNFLANSGLTHIGNRNVLDNLTEIPDGFLMNTEIRDIDLSYFRNVEVIGDDFLSNTDIRDINLSPLTKLRKIGSQFLNNTALMEVILGGLNLESIGDSFLAENDNLQFVQFIDCSIENIGNYFIGGCEYLGKVDFGNSLKNTTGIGNGFLCNDIRLDTIFGLEDLSVSCKRIGSDFMASCVEIYKIDLNIFKDIESIGINFMDSVSIKQIDFCPIENVNIGDNILRQDYTTGIMWKIVCPNNDILTKIQCITYNTEEIYLMSNDIQTSILDKFLANEIGLDRINSRLKIFVPINLLETYQNMFPEISKHFVGMASYLTDNLGRSFKYTTVDGYRLNDGELRISDNSIIYHEQLPASNEYLVVYANIIEYLELFYNSHNIKTLDFSNLTELRELKNGTCSYLSNCTTIIFGDCPKLTTIGAECLSSNTNLSKLNIKGFVNVNEIGHNVLEFNENIKIEDLEDNLKTFGANLQYFPEYFIRGYRNFETLDLNIFPNIKELRTGFLANWPNLKYLDFSPWQSHLTSIEMNFLVNSPNIEVVDLSIIRHLETWTGVAFKQNNALKIFKTWVFPEMCDEEIIKTLEELWLYSYNVETNLNYLFEYNENRGFGVNENLKIFVRNELLDRYRNLYPHFAFRIYPFNPITGGESTDPIGNYFTYETTDGESANFDPNYSTNYFIYREYSETKDRKVVQFEATPTKIFQNFGSNKYNLKSINLSTLDKIESIGNNFLSNTSNLEKVYLKGIKNINEIGGGFMYMSSVKYIDSLNCLRSINTIPGGFLSVTHNLDEVDLSPLKNVKEVYAEEFMTECGLTNLNLLPLSNIEKIYGEENLPGINCLTGLLNLNTIIISEYNHLKLLWTYFNNDLNSNYCKLEEIILLNHPSYYKKESEEILSYLVKSRRFNEITFYTQNIYLDDWKSSLATDNILPLETLELVQKFDVHKFTTVDKLEETDIEGIPGINLEELVLYKVIETHPKVQELITYEYKLEMLLKGGLSAQIYLSSEFGTGLFEGNDYGLLYAHSTHINGNWENGISNDVYLIRYPGFNKFEKVEIFQDGPLLEFDHILNLYKFQEGYGIAIFESEIIDRYKANIGDTEGSIPNEFITSFTME